MSETFIEIIKNNGVEKFNPYHDRLGRFTTAGGGASFSGKLLHGSPNKDIKELDIAYAGTNTSSGEKLLFFTDNKKMADDFSYERLDGSTKFTDKRGQKGKVYDVKVSMKKPLDLRHLSDKDIDNILDMAQDEFLTKDMVKQFSAKNNQLLKPYMDLTPQTLSKYGYDGFIANAGKGATEYAVISNEQAKIIR